MPELEIAPVLGSSRGKQPPCSMASPIFRRIGRSRLTPFPERRQCETLKAKGEQGFQADVLGYQPGQLRCTLQRHR